MADLIERDSILEKIETIQKAYILHEPAGMNGLSAVTQCKEAIKNHPTANCLVPCSERMPEKDGNYLCYTEDGDFLQAYYDSGIDDDFPFGIWEQHYDSGTLGWAGEDWVAYGVITHWMPLPEPPKGE